MGILRLLATYYVPETAEGRAFQGETLVDGLPDDSNRYGHLLGMVHDHIKALAEANKAQADQAAA